MSAAAVGAALAWLIISMYVKERGGGTLKWFVGFWFNVIVIQFALWTGEYLSK